MNQLDPAIYRMFLANLFETGQYLESAKRTGRGTGVFYQHEREDAEFKDQVDAIYERIVAAADLKRQGLIRRHVALLVRRGGWPLGRPAPTRTEVAGDAASGPGELIPSIPAGEPPMPGDEPMWLPLDGPQRQAYDSAADILLYGGAAGGGKSDLLVGLALTRHRHAIVFRREFPQLKALEDRAVELSRLHGRYNHIRHLLQFRHVVAQKERDRRLEFGAVSLVGDMHKYQGRAHDLKAFDEITHFTESQFRYLIGWNRSADPAQRIRVVAAGNPPTGAEGDWVVKYWGPWLDKQHPRPAKPGELRWYATIDGEEREVEGGAPIRAGKELIQPVSRSFVPARVEDNPYLMATSYKSRLQSLPEPLRSQLLEGDFGVAQSDQPDQLIPTEWVQRAMDRWSHLPPEHLRHMTHLGVDVARGGRDRTVIVVRHGTWFAWPKVWPGRDTPDGPIVAQNIAHIVSQGSERRNLLDKPLEHAIVQIDVIGVGGSVFDMVQMQGLTAVALSSAAISTARDRTGQLSFINKRAEWWWRLREALDPDLGIGLALPPDRELMADLTAPRWELALHGIKIESKDAIRSRIGRSTDKGDALIYAFAATESDNWAYVRREIERKRREEARDKVPREQTQIVARTTYGQPYFAFNPDGSRRPDIEPLDPATVKPGPWWRFNRLNQFELLDPWAKYKR